MKLSAYILPLLTLTFAALAGSAQAGTLIITDNSAPHADILRYEPFFASLTATPHDEPKSNDEITVTGPSYEWRGGGDGLHVESSGDNHAKLKSAQRPFYGSVSDLKSNGNKKAIVTCIATYSRANAKTKEPLSPLAIKGTLDVSFFVRVPKLVESYGKRPNTIETPTRVAFPNDPNERDNYIVFDSPYKPTVVPYRDAEFGINTWGAGDVYNMKLTDNKGEHYGHGVVYESFPLVTPQGENPNGDIGPNHWDPPTWEDFVQKTTPPTDPPTAIAPQPADMNAVWLEFNQLWYVVEYGDKVDLNTHTLKLTPLKTSRNY